MPAASNDWLKVYGFKNPQFSAGKVSSSGMSKFSRVIEEYESVHHSVYHDRLLATEKIRRIGRGKESWPVNPSNEVPRDITEQWGYYCALTEDMHN